VKLAFVFFLAILGISSQLSAQQTSPPPVAADAAAVDPKVHAAVLKLFDVMHMRQKMIDGLQNDMPESKAQFLKEDPNVTPEFAAEWSKRMLDESSADAYIAVITKVYEKHFNLSLMEDLIQMQQNIKDGKPPAPAPELQEKLTKDGAEFAKEVMTACAQVSVDRSDAIVAAVTKEHPEWVKNTGKGEDKK
jgi:hypothetical protein